MVFGLPGMLYIYIYCKATSHLTIVRCLRFVLCIASIRFTQSGDMKWGFFDWGCVSTRHNSTPNPNGRCDVSKDHPFLFISLIGGFDENYFSPTPLPSLQQSLITNYLDYLWTFWILRFRAFWTPKTWHPFGREMGIFHPLPSGWERDILDNFGSESTFQVTFTTVEGSWAPKNLP